MSSSKYIFTLDLHSRVSQISLPCTVGDTDRSLVISFSDGGRAYQLPEGAWAMISIKRPSGTSVQVACHADATQVTYEFDKHTCVMAGIHDCQIALYNVEGKRIASPGFTLDVAPKYVDEDDFYMDKPESRAKFEYLRDIGVVKISFIRKMARNKLKYMV